MAFDLPLPLNAAEQPAWAVDARPRPGGSRLRSRSARRPDRLRRGDHGDSANSAVQARAATNGALGPTAVVPIKTNDDGTFGLNSLAVTPDGQSLLTTGGDDTTAPIAEVVYPLSLPNLGVGPRTRLVEPRLVPRPRRRLPSLPIRHRPPRLAGAAPVQVGQPDTFDASASTVAYGSVNAFAWNFGDGATANTATPLVSHAFSDARHARGDRHRDGFGRDEHPAGGAGNRLRSGRTGPNAVPAGLLSARSQRGRDGDGDPDDAPPPRPPRPPFQYVPPPRPAPPPRRRPTRASPPSGCRRWCSTRRSGLPAPSSPSPGPAFSPTLR